MKNDLFRLRIYAAIALALTFAACDKEQPEKILQLTVASQRQLVTREVWGSDSPVTYPVYLVREDDAARWEPFDHTIVGFDYTTGFEYRIAVRVEPFPDRECIADDVPEHRYTLRRLIGSVRKESEGLPAGTVAE